MAMWHLGSTVSAFLPSIPQLLLLVRISTHRNVYFPTFTYTCTHSSATNSTAILCGGFQLCSRCKTRDFTMKTRHGHKRSRKWGKTEFLPLHLYEHFLGNTRSKISHWYTTKIIWNKCPNKNNIQFKIKRSNNIKFKENKYNKLSF